MKAYVLINTRTGGVKEVIKNLRRIDSIIEANMTFGPYDVIAVIEAEDINGVGTILANEIQPIPDVMETLTCLTVDV